MATDWTCDSNDALTLSLVRAPEDKDAEVEAFHPTFTYPIYGEDEKIYGYRDLVIDLRFASGSLAPFLAVQHSATLPSTSTGVVDDVKGTLAEYLPEEYETDEDAFLRTVAEDATSFKPLGTRVHAYTRGDVEYEVYHATWANPGFREYHRRMQLFILLYIEAGSYINEDEDPWEFFVLYEKRKRNTAGADDVWTYHFVGYSSIYNFYCFPEKIRMRLSQFVILPPYQRQGHGSELYGAIYTHVLTRPDVAELTVEDPAEAFEDLRDRCDLRMLLAHPVFLPEALGADSPHASHGGGKVQKARHGKGKAAGGRGKLGPPTDRVWAEKWRVQLKIAKRQYQRLTEMLIQRHLDPLDTRAQRAYRLQVKERLYRFNFEVLVQLEKDERLEKLEETFRSVREDYERILGLVRV